MLEQKLEKLVAAGISLVPADLKKHVILERDGFVALVERYEDNLGQVGAAGLLTEHGLAPLVWREQKAFFVVRTFQQEATPDQVSTLRQFQADLESALR